VAEAESRCPRCGGAFHCGANDATPCACTGVALDAAALAELRARYTGCLCLNCLRELAAENPKDAR
jgi:cysteine-rich CWC protein